jgi:hypothetical protein
MVDYLLSFKILKIMTMVEEKRNDDFEWHFLKITLMHVDFFLSTNF